MVERRAQLQARFAAQRSDLDWASSAARQLADDVTAHASAEVRMRTIECRASLCRVELATDDREAGQRFVEDWVRHRTWTGPGFASTEGNSLVVFVGRDVHALDD